MNRAQLKELNKNRSINQICYVTHDYRKTIEYMCNVLNIGPWTIIAHSDKATKEVKFQGEAVEGPFEFYCAFAFIGNVQIEVVQPVKGKNPYEEFLNQRGPGIHHIKECIKEENRLFSAINDYKNKGIKVIYQGKYKEDLFFYLDTMSALGSEYELGNCPIIETHPTLIGYYPEK